jgi:hypothetical protein
LFVHRSVEGEVAPKFEKVARESRPLVAATDTAFVRRLRVRVVPRDAKAT